MKKYRLSFTKNNTIKYITMYELNYNEFFKFMIDKPNIAKQFEKYMKIDIKEQEKIIIKDSIINTWKNNKNLKSASEAGPNKVFAKFCILIYKNNYIGSFRYQKNKYDSIHGIDLYSKIYTKMSVVYIIPEYRKLGLAYKMLNKIINDKSNYFLIVDGNNKGAVILYKNLGFKKIGGKKDRLIFVRMSI
jgi:ribosomal protein S18 acetylase RimI-like enzyme